MKNHNKPNRIFTATLLSATLATPFVLQVPAVQAKDKGYAEATLYRTTLKADGESASPLAANLRIGTKITDFVSLEGLFGFGVGDDEIGNSDAKVELKSLFGANVVGHYDLNDSATVFGRIGFAQIDVEADGASADDTGLSYGMGFRIKTSFYGSVSIEYTQWPKIDNNQGELKASGIGIGYHLRY